MDIIKFKFTFIHKIKKYKLYDLSFWLHLVNFPSFSLLYFSIYSHHVSICAKSVNGPDVTDNKTASDGKAVV